MFLIYLSEKRFLLVVFAVCGAVWCLLLFVVFALRRAAAGASVDAHDVGSARQRAGFWLKLQARRHRRRLLPRDATVAPVLLVALVSLEARVLGHKVRQLGIPEPRRISLRAPVAFVEVSDLNLYGHIKFSPIIMNMVSIQYVGLEGDEEAYLVVDAELVGLEVGVLWQIPEGLGELDVGLGAYAERAQLLHELHLVDILLCLFLQGTFAFLCPFKE